MIHRIEKSVLITLLGMLLTPAVSQEKYTLKECKNMALENNIKIKKAYNNKATAEETRKEAFTNYFPTVSASAVGFKSNKGLMQLSIPPLAQGMTEMNMEFVKDGIVGNIMVVQPIFAGHRVANGNKLAEIGVSVSELQLEQSEKEVLLTTEQYYWQVVVVTEKLKTVNTMEEMLNSMHKDVKLAVDVGVTSRNDLLQVKLQENELESQKINLENNLDFVKLVLAQYIGKESANFDVATTIDKEITVAPKLLFVNHEASLREIPEYHLLEQNVEASKLQYKMEQGKNLPTVAVGAAYIHHDLLDAAQNNGLVFAQVAIPISAWWGGSHKMKSVKLKIENAENDLTDNSELLILRMQKAWIDLQNAYQQIAIAQKSIEQSEENLRMHKDYYQAGTITISDYLQAQSLYQQSQDKFVEAFSQYKIKSVEYKQVTGQEVER